MIRVTGSQVTSMISCASAKFFEIISAPMNEKCAGKEALKQDVHDDRHRFVAYDDNLREASNKAYFLKTGNEII